MTHPLTVVVFGSTGDLMRQKLMPAFAALWKQRILDASSLIVGVGRRGFDDATITAARQLCADDESL